MVVPRRMRFGTLIKNNMETWQEVTDLKTSIIRHFQEEVGASYDFRDIIDNLHIADIRNDEVLDSIISWAESNNVLILKDKICHTT